jgi:hypothetical protein
MMSRIDSRHWTISSGRHFQNGVVAILKMATSRNCSMSGINSGHHYVPRYKIMMISDNVEFLWYILKMATGRNCSISVISSGHHNLPVNNDVPNWFPTLNNFYRMPFSKWPPQYHTNSTLSDFNAISYVGNLPTYQIVMISDNVDILRYCGDP